MQTHLYITVLAIHQAELTKILEYHITENQDAFDIIEGEVTPETSTAPSLSRHETEHAYEHYLSDILNSLELAKIPYDAEHGDTEDWEAGEISFRVLSDGSTQRIEDESDLSIRLDVIAKAYEAGTIESLLNREFATHSYINWKTQANVFENIKRLTQFIEANPYCVALTEAITERSAQKANTSCTNKVDLENQVANLIRQGFWIDSVPKANTEHVPRRVQPPKA